MHKLRNKQHQEILARVMQIIPPGYKEPILQKMKRRTRQFCASRNWDERRILEEIENDTWFYSSYFFDE